MRPGENPFRAEKISSLSYRLTAEPWEALLGRLAALRFRAAVVGPEGSGKSTFLRELARRLPSVGRTPHLVRRSRSEPVPLAELLANAPKRLAPTDVLLLDAADALSRLEWLRVKTHAARARCGLVITRHLAGPLPELVRCAPDESVLLDVVRELLEASRAEGIGVAFDLPAVERAALDRYRRHGGNMREALRSLYDAAAEGTLAYRERLVE